MMNKKIIYKNNPLTEVILQVKFPTILSINVKEPADFQEAIRKEFPIYNVDSENQSEIVLQDINKQFAPAIKNLRQKNYVFIAESGTTKINLTSNFISISTLKYNSWETFINDFSKPLSAFIDIYEPAFFERIGLRYIDVYSREKLNLVGIQWRELIKNHLLGILSEMDENKVEFSSINTEYLLDDNLSRAKINAGLGISNDNNEKVFVIDSDFMYISILHAEMINKTVNYLHENAKKFIEGAITEKLKMAMKPEII